MADRDVIEELSDGRLRPGARDPYRDFQDRLVALAMNALSGRALVWVVALSNSGAWWWTVLHPSTLGIIATAAATVSTFVPTLWWARRD